MLLHSGIPLVSALEALRAEAGNTELREALVTITQDVRGGVAFSAALNGFPRIFPAMFRRLVAAGERAGDMEGFLTQLVKIYTGEVAMKKRLQRALIYPAIVFVVAIAVAAILIVVVLPQVQVLASAVGAELPLFTRVFLAGAAGLNHYKLHIVAGLLVAGVSFYLAFRDSGRRLRLHSFLLRVPVFGKIIIYREVARLSRYLSILLSAGLPLPETLELIGRLIGNDGIRKTVDEMRQEVLAGHQMAAPLARAAFVPPLFVQAVRTGELTGSLTANLTNVADFYESELDNLLQSAIAMLEPAMTVVMGIVVGLLALSVIIPIYSIVGQVGGSS
jgi:type IV pilus assembly protein PilC